MSDADPMSDKPGQMTLPPDVAQTGPPVTDATEFHTSFGETLDQALDLDTWHHGEDLAHLYGRLEQEITVSFREPCVNQRQ